MLKSAEIGLLATIGRIHKVKVYKKPIIGLISSGNELVDASTTDLPDGKIRDSNKLMLKALFKEHQVNAEIVDFGQVSDDQESLHTLLQNASK